MTNSRRKGASGELEVAKLFAKALPGVDVRRGGFGQAQQGNGAADVETEGLFRIEVKRLRKLTAGLVRRAVAQAHKDAKEGEVEMACLREDRGKWVGAMGAHELRVFLDELESRQADLNGLIFTFPLEDMLRPIREWHERGGR